MSIPRIDLGSETLSATLLSSVEIYQALNQHWTCRIVLRDAPLSRPEIEDFAGQPLKISTYALDGTEMVLFKGFVRRMRLIYEVTGAYGAELQAISATWKAAQGPRLAYYRQSSAQDAATKALAASGLSLSGAMAAGTTLSYVQWHESDFDFFARLVDDGEAWFRPAVDGSDSVEVQSAFQPGPTVQWRIGEYNLLQWTTHGRLQPITALGATYDPQPMHSVVPGAVSSSTSFYGDAAEAMVTATQGASVPARWADRHRSATLADYDARLEREARRGLASAVTCTGISREPEVRAGDTVTIEGLEDVDATYGVIAVVHRWTTQGYENEFTATPAQRWSPPTRPPRPCLEGLYEARVVDNHDPHNQGRIRVQYYWQESGETTWIRLLSVHAGSSRGFLFLPEKGEEVLIAFEEGDAERPYVVGAAWNGVHQPPAAGFHKASEQNGTEFAANNLKRLVTKSGHRITFVDTPGIETVSIATHTSTQFMLTEHHADTGRPAIVLSSKGDILLSAPNGRIHSQSKFHSRDVGLQLPPKSPLAGMTCKDKMEAAIKRAPLSQGVLDALGGAKGIAAGLTIMFVAAAASEFTPAGWAADIVAALIAAGMVIFAYQTLKQLLAGLEELYGFYKLCCKEAETEADLDRASKLFADAVGKIGVSTLSLILARFGMKAKKSAAGEPRNPFENGRTPTATELETWSERNGWTRTQTENGPIKYTDQNGVVRTTIKKGSSRAPGSSDPHVELRDAQGRRVDPLGNPVPKKSPSNHTPIVWDK